MQVGTSQSILSITSSYHVEQLSNIHPRLCTLHKWSHFDGYGIHLSCNEHWRGLHIEDIEPNSPAESAGLLREDIILAVNGRSIENEDFFLILSFIQHELEQDQIRFLVLDPYSAELAQQYQMNIDENNENCIRTETSQFIQSLKHIKDTDQIIAQNSSHKNLVDTYLDLDKSEPRICSIALRPGDGSIGISLQSDTDFSHVITQVQSNSLADRAGIKPNDCIISLNNILLLQIPFEDVLYHLAKIRNETKLDFVVAKKSYLLKLSQNQLMSYKNEQIYVSTNSTVRNRSSTLSDTRTLEQLDRTQQQIIADEQYDRLSLQIYSNLNVTKNKKRQRKILGGIGPATALRFSWSITSEKTVDYSSVRSDLYGQRPVMEEIKERRTTMKDIMNFFQVGMTNPSPKLQARRFQSDLPNANLFANGQQSTNQSPSSIGRFNRSPKVLPSPNIAMKNIHTSSQLLKNNKTIQNILNNVPITPIQLSPTLSNRKKDNRQISQSKFYLTTIPISELSNHGYELRTIKLMKPAETSPIGFKLTKQNDPFQYIMTAIAEQSKADQAGLKVGDWLIKIEDFDVRLSDFQVVLQDINQLINTVGSINIAIARKKSLNEINILSSVGLSNPTLPSPKGSPSTQSTDSNLNKIRHITLNTATGLYSNSFISNNNDGNHVHYVDKIQPTSLAYRSGLRDHDRILTVNGMDVRNISKDELQSLLSQQTPIELTVIKDSKAIESIENYKHNEIEKTLSTTIYETIDHRVSEDFNNILFVDDQGPIYIKHCIINKDITCKTLGLVLSYEDNVHIINRIEIDYPGYDSGLHEHDIILFINKKNTQQLSHDDVTTLLRTLVSENQNIDLIILKKDDLQRYQDYQKENFIDWNNIFSKIYGDSTYNIQNNQEHDYVNQPSSSASFQNGDRTCIVETKPNQPLGFSIECVYPPPFIISRIEKDSPANKAGLQLNDSLLSINGKSVHETSYEDTIQLIKDSLNQKTISFVVNQTLNQSKTRSKKSSNLSLSYSSGEHDERRSTTRSSASDQPTHCGTNAVHQYQIQRTKELSYTLRLCHLNATTIDGTPASSFGFDISSDPEYEYPVISHIEAKLPGERAGLQNDDILLKVNNRKTKGADFNTVKKVIDKAKRDGRLEMLVADKDTFNYCIKTDKKFKEPYIKVKHIFPQSRSAANFQSLPVLAGRPSMISEETRQQSISNTSHAKRHSAQSEKEEDTVKSSISAPLSCDVTSKVIDSVRKSTERKDTTSPIQNEVSTDRSIVEFVLNTIDNCFQIDYDIPPDRINNSKTNTPLLSNLSKEIRPISQSNNTVHSNQSSVSYDYIKDPRRCILKIDRNKGLGFVLSANGDFDHTITSVDKNSIADAAGLQINDEVAEINGIDVRNIKYEQVVDMLISAMQTNDTIDMYVISPTIDINKGTHNHSLLNNNNNNNLIITKDMTGFLGDNLSVKNNHINSFNDAKQQTINTSYPDLYDKSKYLATMPDRGLSGSVPTLSTGITASPKDFRSTSSKKSSALKVLNISKKDASVARLCRIRKFPTSPFYGFFLCGNQKKLGEVFIADVTKNSSAAICGLRDGDCIIEVNGTNVQTWTYETILNKIKLHMDNLDLELLVLDRKSFRRYRKQKHPLTLQTLPTVVHIEPIINDINSEMQLL